MANKEKQKKTIKDWIRAEGGYQPEPLIGDHEKITPPNTGSNVRVPKKAEPVPGYINTCAVCGIKFVDSELRIFPLCPKCAKEKVTKKSLEEAVKHDDSLLPQLEAQLYAQTMESPWGDLPPTQQKIHEIMGAMTDLLLYKNQKYGDSAINPIEIFAKHIKTVDTKTASILVRIDDKLSRVKNADTLRTNDICDLIGYLTLLNIAIGTTAEDIAKFKD